MPTITRPLSDDLLQFRVDEELFRLTRAASLVRSGRGARTLVKDGPLRVTLIALRAGSRIPDHHAGGPVTIQPVYGSILVEACGERRTLGMGEVVALAAGVEHAVESATGGAFLLTVVTPENS